MIPTLSRPQFINSLHSRLIRQDLPGVAAHLKMAHAIRRVDLHPDVSTTKDAGVLMIIFEKNPGDFYMIFIRRTSTHDGDKHAGQIGFPGGKNEISDPDLMYTALREANEEIAIDLRLIDVLGSLSPLYIPVSKFMVHPFLAYSSSIPNMMRQESEVEEILELPISAFRNTSAIQQTSIQVSSGIILNHVPSYLIDGHRIWGATAMIMSELMEIMDQI